MIFSSKKNSAKSDFLLEEKGVLKPTISGFELWGYVMIGLGVLVLLLGFFLFNLNGYASANQAAFNQELGHYGEFIGGIVGSLWALAGVLLFFATLTYQKREFELQRIELHKTQKIFQQQNFSTLFINLLTQHNIIVNSLTAFDIEQNEWKGSNFFILFKEKVLSSFIGKVRNIPKTERSEKMLQSLLRDYFTYHFSFYQNMLDPYVKNLKVMFDMISRYRRETGDDGEYYSFMIKSNLTQDELFLLYHLSHYEVVDFVAFEHEFNLFEQLLPQNRDQYIIMEELKSPVFSDR